MKEGFNCDILKSNIRFLRRKMNLSQEELATMIGLNRGNIASYESGTAEPRIANLVKMSKLFSVPFLSNIYTKIHPNIAPRVSPNILIYVSLLGFPPGQSGM